MSFGGFFKAQLLKKRHHKREQQKGMLNSIDNQLFRSCPVSKRSFCPQSIDNTCRKMNLPILKKHRNMSERGIVDLSEDLLAEILVRLPVKYILHCRCVQKSWYHLIQTPMFITLHHKTIRDSKYLYFETAYNNDVLKIRLDDVQCQEYCSKIKYLPGLPSDFAWRAVSNGLICTATFLFDVARYVIDNKIYLWNPLVERYKTLPDSPLPFSNTKWKALAFGFVPEINDYVVVHIVKPCLHLARGQRNPHSVFIAVYSLNTNSWKRLSQDNVFIRDISYNDVVFVNGAAFWIGISCNNRKILMCYDTKTDMLREISLPNYVKDWPCVPIIHPFDQSFVAYFIWDNTNNFFEMWVLKYDSNEFSWEKKMRINTYMGFYNDIRVEVLGVRNNGEPILARLFDLISYNLDNNEANDFVDSWDSWTPYPDYNERECPPPFLICPFVESLALLNIV